MRSSSIVLRSTVARHKRRPSWRADTVSLAQVRPACRDLTSSSMGLGEVPGLTNTAWIERTSLVPSHARSDAMISWPSNCPLNTTSRPSADSLGWKTWYLRSPTSVSVRRSGRSLFTYHPRFAVDQFLAHKAHVLLGHRRRPGIGCTWFGRMRLIDSANVSKRPCEAVRRALGTPAQIVPVPLDGLGADQIVFVLWAHGRLGGAVYDTSDAPSEARPDPNRGDRQDRRRRCPCPVPGLGASGPLRCRHRSRGHGRPRRLVANRSRRLVG